jgi:hypothetical protein
VDLGVLLRLDFQCFAKDGNAAGKTTGVVQSPAELPQAVRFAGLWDSAAAGFFEVARRDQVEQLALARIDLLVGFLERNCTENEIGATVIGIADSRISQELRGDLSRLGVVARFVPRERLAELPHVGRLFFGPIG